MIEHFVVVVSFSVSRPLPPTPNLDKIIGQSKTYNCKTCPNVSFRSSSGLFRHNRVKHQGLSDYKYKYPKKCAVCGKMVQKIYQHLLVHDEGKKQYPCPYCDKLFYRGSHMRSHARTHSAEKKYQCVLCDKKFGYKSDLKVHLDRLH